MNNRRDFIKKLLVGGAFLGLSSSKLYAFYKNNVVQLTILHTNDVHSRIEPYPDNHPRFPGQGGFARRAGIVNKIKEEQSNVLLFDAGDIFQGTPYFNQYGGELEFKLMSKMRYDAATMGNHEFDNGLNGFDEQLKHASFPFISSNYDFSDTILNGKVHPYKVFVKEGVKIGVLGLGIELSGLVNSTLYGETRYLDPLEAGNKIAILLKKDLKCDLVVCLSHLGLEYENNKVSDEVVAAKSKNIDLIIGGHSHRLLKHPYRRKNAENKEVVICQAGHSGLNLGRLDYFFERQTKKILASYYTTKKINNQG